MKLAQIDKFQKISIDTRNLVSGDVYVAIIGTNFDGHDFVQQAEAKGAIAAIVSKNVACNISLIKVENTFHALAAIAAQRRQHVNIPIIGLTGSCGKTTTKSMLASILTCCGKVLATKANLNNNIGVSLTLLDLTPAHEFAVIEIGASLPNEIDYAAKLTRPDVAIITNVAPVHLEGFGELDDVARIKGDILRWLTPDGIAILNADDNYFSFWNKLTGNRQIISFAIQNQAEIMALDVTINEHGATQFVLQTPIGNADVALPVLGQHNVMNALAAAAAAYATEIPLTAIKQGLEKVEPVAGRLIKKIGLNGAVILDDTYNANPRSMHLAIQVLVTNSGKKILIAGDMGELGPKAEYYHHQLGITARELGVKNLYAVGKFTPLTVAAFGKEGYHFADRDELIAAVQAKLQPDVAVLVKGSKLNRMWEIVNALSKQEQ